MNEKDKQLEEKAKRIFLDSFAELLENGGCDDEMFKAVIVSTVTPSGDPEIALRGNGNTLLAMTAGIRKVLVEEPSAFDPRKYLIPARELVKQTVSHKIKDVFGSANKA